MGWNHQGDTFTVEGNWVLIIVTAGTSDKIFSKWSACFFVRRKPLFWLNTGYRIQIKYQTYSDSQCSCFWFRVKIDNSDKPLKDLEPCFVLSMCVLNMNLSFNKSHEHFPVSIFYVCVFFGGEDDSGRYITTRNVHVSNHRGFPPERQAHIQSLTWKDFLADRMSDRFLFLKARFFGL